MSQAPEMKIGAIASWFGTNRTLAQQAGTALGRLDWCGVGFAGSMPEIPFIEARTIAVNDKHDDVIRLARVIQKHRRELGLALAGALVHPRELADAQDRLRQARAGGGGGLFAQPGQDPYGGDDVARARDYFVVSWTSRSAVMGTDGELNSNLAVRWDAGGGDTATRFRNACDGLEAWEKALQPCWFTTMDVFDFIAEHHAATVRLNEAAKRKGTKRERRGLFLDPPFPDAGDSYAHKFTDAMHRKLSSAALELSLVRVRVVLRFHDHPLVRELYPEGAPWKWLRLEGGRDMHNKGTPEVLIVAGEAA